MGYFPEDIPFMSEEELRYYGIKIPKDKPKDTSSNVGVYISGLEMPQEGRITLQIDSNGGVYVVNKFSITSEKYEKSMPATEIQSHGRLIDGDALYEEISNGNKAYNGIEGYDGKYPNIGNVDDCLDAIKYADTVIKVEE